MTQISLTTIMTTKTNTSNAVVPEWNKLMQEISRESSNINSQTELYFSEFDQWIAQGHAAAENVEHSPGNSDHDQILSPSIYAETGHVADVDQSKQRQISGTGFIDELKLWFQTLQED